MSRAICLILVVTLTWCERIQAGEVTAQAVEKALREGILQVWFPRVIDREEGGFLCDFDYQWRPSGRQPKTIVYQARMTWLASQAARRYPHEAGYLEAARHGFQFLRERMWDGAHGGWYWRLDRTGQQSPEWQDTKHAYGISFGIYACAAFYEATEDPQALQLAQEAFRWLDEHAHDRKFGGYYEFFRRDGSPILDDAADPLGRHRDSIGTRIGYKSMNTHIHLLEAFTALYHVWPDPHLRQRTLELLQLVRDRVVVPPGAMHQFFNIDWTPVPDLDSIGHDVETAFLLIEAVEALGMRHDPRTMATARSLVDHALEYGWDADRGGFYEACGTFGPVHDRRKVWWSQAEGLNTLLLMAKKFPDDRDEYARLFRQQWQYIQENLMDHEHGEWYAAGLDSGGNAQAPKASEWKAGYHTGRALLNVVRWLEEDGGE
jgi:cellobiose epimerase